MKIADFDVYKDLLYRESGLVITPDKSYLLDSRLKPIAKKWNLPSMDALSFQLRSFPDRVLVKDIVEAMTGGETSFFRDIHPFQTIEDIILPYLQKKKSRKTLRIWCAGCATGQEPYSLAMLLKEKAAMLPGWKFDILATDLSDQALNVARAAHYSQFEVQRGLPVQYLMKYFVQSQSRWQLKDEIRNMVRFSHFNLLKPMASLGTFDLILCRNVLNGFDEKTADLVTQHLTERMEKDGFLIVGDDDILPPTITLKPVAEKAGVYIHTASNHLDPGRKTGLTTALKSMMRI